MESVLQKLQRAIAAGIDGMTTQEMGRHREGKWSTAQVLEHLSLTYIGTIKGFERCIEAGKPLATVPTLKGRLSVLVVTGLGYLPEGRKAPVNTEPRGIPAETIRGSIGPQIAAMDELIGRCELRYGKATRLLDHPILGPLTGAEWRKFHYIHGKHHLKQINRLREMSTL